MALKEKRCTKRINEMTKNKNETKITTMGPKSKIYIKMANYMKGNAKYVI